MRLHRGDIRLLVAATIILSGGVLVARSHHDLNGTWKLIPTRSEFGGEPVIQTGTVTINDREHNVSVARNFTYDGANQTTSYGFSTDGRENSTIRNGKTFKSKAKWEGDVLLVTTTQDQDTVVEHYDLQPGGLLRLVVERAGHAPVTLMFERA